MHCGFQITRFLRCIAALALVGCTFTGTIGNANKATCAAGASIMEVVGRNWSFKVFNSYADPTFYEITDRGRVSRFLASYRKKLGRVTSLKVVKSAEAIKLGAVGSFVVAEIVFDARFKKTTGKIALQLVDRDRGWRIGGLHIASDAFLR